VVLDQSDFGKVQAAIKAKYGEPASENANEYQNAFGAKFEGTMSAWRNNTSFILAIERAGTLDTSLVIVAHEKLGALVDERLSVINEPKVNDF
jgi:hypothetical protein